MPLNITFEKDSKSDYTYSDLHLDLQKEKIPLGESHSTRRSGNSDIKTDFDEMAIANSVRNLFSTRPKQRILDPEYGLDLSQFLFEAANEFNARFIARKIARAIELYEPRIVLKYVNVTVNEEDNLYDLSLIIYVPSLNKNVNFGAVFDENGFTI